MFICENMVEPEFSVLQPLKEDSKAVHDSPALESQSGKITGNIYFAFKSLNLC